MKSFLKRQLLITGGVTVVVVVGRIVTALTDGITDASDAGAENRGWFVIGILLVILSLVVNGCYSMIVRLRQHS
ncbi:MAG TPA: hypothetical protein VLI54_01710 [Bacillota bacterium]|nr:hypothetical protein [Bacillota bacterium]